MITPRTAAKIDEDKAALQAAQEIKKQIPDDAIHAASKGHLRALNYLLGYNLIDPNQVLVTNELRPRQTTLLSEALIHKQVGVASQLLDEYKLTPLTVNQCVIETVAFMNVTVYHGNPLCFAIQLGNLDLIIKLLQHGADPARCVDADKLNSATVAKPCDPYVPAVIYVATCSQLATVEKTQPGIRKGILKAILPFSKVTLSAEQQILVDSILSAAPTEAKKADAVKKELDPFDADYTTDPYELLTPNYKSSVDRKKRLKLEDKIQNCALDAAAKGHLETLKFLFKVNMADANQIFQTGEYRYGATSVTTTLLIEALIHHQIATANMLVNECKLTPETINVAHVENHSSQTTYFGNALTYAINEGEPRLVGKLLLCGAEMQCVKDSDHNISTMWGGWHDPYVHAVEYVKTCSQLAKVEKQKPGIRQKILDEFACCASENRHKSMP